MVIRISLVVCLVVSALTQLNAQSDESKRWFNFNDEFNNKRVYLYWGYNRALFSKTDVHFHGNGYDFTIYDATAHDRPTPFSFNDYANPTRLTVPQYVFHIGYHLHNNLHVSFGNDHMKYVLTKNQQVKLSGAIDTSLSMHYAGMYFDQDTKLDPEFLRFEHTDGLNLYTLNLEYLLPVYRTLNNKVRVSWNFGVGGIWVVTKTDVRIAGMGLDNDFHIAGFSIPVHTGLRTSIGKYFFVLSEIKAGYVHLPWVLIQNNAVDLADHNFMFLERYTAAGFSLPLSKRR